MRFDKRFKSVHRCRIVDTQGELMLTVPISRPSTNDGPLHWNQVRVSSHGQWWSDHRISLESAYGRTPFFEFYIDRLLPFLQDLDITITELDQAIDKVVREILHLPVKVEYANLSEKSVRDLAEECIIESSKEDLIEGEEIIDFRKNDFSHIAAVPYYQIRALQLGFFPDLSILDLIFNLGPESPLILDQMNS